jgi:hypothetical protein
MLIMQAYPFRDFFVTELCFVMLHDAIAMVAQSRYININQPLKFSYMTRDKSENPRVDGSIPPLAIVKTMSYKPRRKL